MFKVGDRVRSKKYGDGTVIFVDSVEKATLLPISVRFDKTPSYTLWCGFKDSVSPYNVTLIPSIKVGDTVRLIDKYYEHEDFKKLSRCERKRVSDFNGESAVCERESYIDDWMNVKTVGYYESIPLSLLERVEPEVKAEPIPAERLVNRHAKVGEKIRIVDATATAGHYKNGDTLTVNSTTDSDDGFVWVDGFFHVIYPYEYLVIESGKHVYTDEQKAEALRIASEIFNKGYADAFAPDGIVEINAFGKHGSAKCAPTDEFSYAIGMMVAACHATGRKLPDWIK